jgi:hypothetical protein
MRNVLQRREADVINSLATPDHETYRLTIYVGLAGYHLWMAWKQVMVHCVESSLSSQIMVTVCKTDLPLPGVLVILSISHQLHRNTHEATTTSLPGHTSSPL